METYSHKGSLQEYRLEGRAPSSMIQDCTIPNLHNANPTMRRSSHSARTGLGGCFCKGVSSEEWEGVFDMVER